MEQISRIGMDTSKRFFQLHGVNAAETVMLRKKLRRKELHVIRAAVQLRGQSSLSRACLVQSAIKLYQLQSALAAEVLRRLGRG
jgi:hypothetical protein